MRRRAGLLLMLVGLLLASVAALLVLGMAQQTQQQAVQQIKQVYVVTVAKDVPENTILSPEMLAVKAFPADFAPPSAVATVEEATGKFAATKLFKDTVLLRSQISGAKKARDVAANLPPGKVAFWLPLPELITSTGGLKTGDRVDVLLTVTIGDKDAKEGKFFSTQTTLQNIEVFSVGTVEQAIDSGAQPGSAAATAAAGAASAARTSGSRSGEKQALVLLVDHQDAVILKFVKDVDGVIDLVLRSADDAQIVKTDGMSNDTLIDRFKFRVPLHSPQSQNPSRP